MKSLTKIVVFVGGLVSASWVVTPYLEAAQNKPEVVQDWSYSCRIQAEGTRSEGRWGYLYYRQKMLVAPVGTVVVTPAGKFLFFGRYDLKGWGEHGWNNVQCYGRPIFEADGSVRKDMADGFQAAKISIIEITGAELLKINGIEPKPASAPSHAYSDRP